jgi:hypothetical protein
MMRRTDRYYLTRGVLVALLLGILAWGVWDHNERVQAESRRDRLVSADMSEVPAILAEIGAHRRHVEPLLRAGLADDIDPKKKLRLSLALTPGDRGQVKFLYEELLHATPQEFAVIRDVLAPYQEELRNDLWKELAAPPGSERRFRAAFALIEYARDDPRWPQCASLVVDGLVAESPLALIHWKNALAPVKDRVLASLAYSLEDAKWNAVERRAIIEFYRLIAAGDAKSLEPLRARITMQHSGTTAERARRKATVLAALAALGEADRVWPFLVHTPDPTLRSYLIERLGSSGVDPHLLKDRLDVERDTSARHALILTLGAFPSDRLTGMRSRLVELYWTDSDNGVHAAADWVLRKWKHAPRPQDHVGKAAAPGHEEQRSWYVNSQGQTLSVIRGPLRLRLGNEVDANLAMHRYAVGATEVTVEQFRAFRPDHVMDREIHPTPDSPVTMVSWHDAAAYCNWLSDQECILKDQWCYLKRADGAFDLVPDYQRCSGYRLLTEDEWEFACRAGAATACSFGEPDEELAGNYAWWFGSVRSKGSRQCLPVALLRPNDWGLFDMHGNVAEWCQESPKQPLGKAVSEMTTAGRGSSYQGDLRNLRADERFAVPRRMAFRHVGFRIARTLPR